MMGEFIEAAALLIVIAISAYIGWCTGKNSSDMEAVRLLRKAGDRIDFLEQLLEFNGICPDCVDAVSECDTCGGWCKDGGEED